MDTLNKHIFSKYAMDQDFTGTHILKRVSVHIFQAMYSFFFFFLSWLKKRFQK